MFDNTPDAFSYASCNGKKIADIEQELNTYLLANPINKLLKLVNEMNTQIGVIQYQLKELKINNVKNSNN